MCKNVIYMVSFILVLGLAGLSNAASVGFQAEDGMLGADFDPPISDLDGLALGGRYITSETTSGGGSPGTEERMATYTVTFPEAGTYNLYVRLLVEEQLNEEGQAGPDNDSMFYGNGFGTKPATSAADWIQCNGFEVNPRDEWLWINLSEDTGAFGEGGVLFTVPEGELTQTLQIGAREDGLRIDAFVFVTTGQAVSDQELTDAVPVETKAVGPIPADGSTVTETSLTLSWRPGALSTHSHVYFSDNFDDVNDRTEQADKVLTTELTYAVSGLVPGTVYYWVIDEVDVEGDEIWPGDVWRFQVESQTAYNPDPHDGKINTVLDVVLSWSAGVGAVSHLVYLDADMANVDARTDCLVNGAGTADPSYSPGPLDPDTTYYWAIDEVGADDTTFAGQVWNFTTVPDIQMTDDPNLIGWWTFDEGAGTTALDRSGHGNHGAIQGNPAWVAGPGDDTMALDFDGVGDFVDIGTDAIFDVTEQITVAAWVRVDVFEQTDQAIVSKGQNVWRLVRNGLNTDQLRFDCGGQAVGSTNVNDGEWHHALGMSDGATISLYVDGQLDGTGAGTSPIPVDPNLTLWIADTNRPGSGPQAWNGPIDEVRIYNKALTEEEIRGLLRINPLLAWSPSPSNGSTPGPDDVTTLSWTSGENAVEHDVYFGMDQSAVADANTSDTTGIYQGRQGDTSFVPADALQTGQTYYWRIDEVQADGTITPGSVWTFWVRDYLIVDDFESYTDGRPNRIFETWRDRFSYTDAQGNVVEEGNGSGMTVGVDEAPFGPERTIVYGGAQSLPLSYDNTAEPFYSETDRTFATAQNWQTWHGTDLQTLSLWFQGRWASSNGFVADGSTYTVTGSGVDIWNTADEFHYVYLPLSGDGSITAKVESLDNTDDWAKAGVMMRNGLDADAANLAALVAPSGRVTFQQREFAGNETTSQETGAGSIALPYWVRLTRAGGIVTGEMSADGQTWEMIEGNSSVGVSWFGDVYVGLAVTSHVDAGTPAEAVLSNVTVTGATGSVFDTSMDIGLSVNDPADLYVTLEDAGGQTVTVHHEDNPNAVTQSDWVQWLIPLDDLDSQVDLTQVQKMIIGIGDQQSTGEGKLFIDDIHVLP